MAKRAPIDSATKEYEGGRTRKGTNERHWARRGVMTILAEG